MDKWPRKLIIFSFIVVGLFFFAQLPVVVVFALLEFGQALALALAFCCCPAIVARFFILS